MTTGCQALEQSSDSSTQDRQVVSSQPAASKKPVTGPGNNGKACNNETPRQKNKNCRPPSGAR
jgi:hypothetical protein